MALARSFLRSNGLMLLETSVAGRGRLREINVTVPEDPELDTILLVSGNSFDLDAKDNLPAESLVAGCPINVGTEADAEQGRGEIGR